MVGSARLPFAAELRRRRLDAGLTQQALAERAGLSARGVQGLEAGERHPYPDSLERLVSALGLEGDERTRFLEAGRRPPRGGQTRGMVGPIAPPRHNLQEALTSLIGRERAANEVRGLLEAHRLVTLTGTGGIGKTRLALDVARGLVSSYADGVWLVELASLADSTLVVPAAAAVLRVSEQPGGPPLAALAGFLRDRRSLLVLDNCEHLLDSIARLASTLLRACPPLAILATSRERLNVEGEHVYAVSPLALPSGPPAPIADVVRADAVRLFFDRALAVRRGFAPTECDTRLIAQICRRLDGIPLAIELAAAWVRALSLEQVAAQLDGRLSLLTGGSRAAPHRHRTLRAAIDWSHVLLSEAERSLFARLSAFPSSWTLEAAEAVCAGEGVLPADVLPLLACLVDKSLLVADERDGAMRYRWLETIRDYARERLAASGEAPQVRPRHADHYAALAERAGPRLAGPERDEWLDVLEAEADNFRAALAWSFSEVGNPDTGTRMCSALWWFWYFRGGWSEGRGWLEEALARGSPDDSAPRAGAADGAGMLAYLLRDLPAARAHLEAAVSMWRRLGDTTGLAHALTFLSIVARDMRDLAAARAASEESVGLLRPLADAWGLAFALTCQGNVARDLDDDTRALAAYREGLPLWRGTGDRWGMALCLGDLASLAHRRGDLAEARELSERSLAIRRTAGDRFLLDAELTRAGAVARAQRDNERASALFEEKLAMARGDGHAAAVAWSLQNLGYIEIETGDPGRARALLREGLLLHARAGHALGMALCLGGLARLASSEGASATAARLLGAAVGIVERLGNLRGVAPTEMADHAVNAALAERLARDPASAGAFVEGRSEPQDTAVARALESFV